MYRHLVSLLATVQSRKVPTAPTVSTSPEISFLVMHFFIELEKWLLSGRKYYALYSKK